VTVTPERVDDVSASPRGGVSVRFPVAFSAGVVLALILSSAGLARFGAMSSVAPASPSIVIVDDSKSLLAAWRNARLHGVVLVDATRDLQYYGVSVNVVPLQIGWPVTGRDIPAVYEGVVDRRNVVWVAAKTGIARTVAHLLVPADLDAKIRDGRKLGYTGIAAGGRSITANDEGYLRSIADVVPVHVGSPAVLNIDASYFINGDPEQLLAQLGDSLSTYRMVTLDRALDATNVPQAARMQVDTMAGLLRQRGIE